MRGGLGRLLILALAIGGGPALAKAAPESAPVVTYTVSPRFDGEDLSGLVVGFALEADGDGVTRLDLPDRWMGRGEAWRHISDLTVDGATSVVEDGPAVRVVRSPPRRRLAVRYVLTSAIDHEPREADGYPARPWVRPSWFYIDGESAFVTVEGGEGGPVRFRWENWPRTFTLASNLERPDAKDVRQSVLMGGRDVRLVRVGDFRLALHGAFGVSDAALAHELDEILRAERGFFGDPETAPYLVTAASLPVDAGGYFTGTGKGDAFAMVATPTMTLDDLRVLLAHEIFHSWNPGRLGQPIGPSGYWFSEGFTDFYARRLLLRARLITPQAFVEVWNGMLRGYGVSPARRLTGSEAAKAFWTDPHAEALLYQRGAMLAALWDQRLRRQGSSLDTVLRAQAKAFAARPEAKLTELFVEQAALQGLDVRADIETYVEQGRAMDLPADLFAPCADLAEVRAPSFDLGFLPQMNGQGLMIITGLRQDSAAYRAGLRDGMTVVEKSRGTNGDATQPYVLRVRSIDGVLRTLSFLPAGSGTVAYPRLTLRVQAVDAPEACDFRR